MPRLNVFKLSKVQELKISEALGRASFKDKKVSESLQHCLTARQTIDSNSFEDKLGGTLRLAASSRLPKLRYIRKFAQK